MIYLDSNGFVHIVEKNDKLWNHRHGIDRKYEPITLWHIVRFFESIVENYIENGTQVNMVPVPHSRELFPAVKHRKMTGPWPQKDDARVRSGQIAGL
jgi:hypothetical protein